MTDSIQQRFTSYVLFLAGWSASVWGAANGFPWLSVVVILPTLLLHLDRARTPVTELKLLALCGSIGIFFDSLLLAFNWVAFPDGEWIPGLAPYWMVILWLILVPTLNLSRSWLKNTSRAVSSGAVGGPLVYLMGEQLGVIELLNPFPALLAQAIGWGIVVPLLVAITVRLNAVVVPNPPEFFPAK